LQLFIKTDKGTSDLLKIKRLPEIYSLKPRLLQQET